MKISRHAPTGRVYLRSVIRGRQRNTNVAVILYRCRRRRPRRSPFSILFVSGHKSLERSPFGTAGGKREKEGEIGRKG